MKKCLGILILCIAVVSSLSAAVLTATVTEVAGKVECKLPGTNWRAAKTGDVLPAGSLISTGFKSTAILKTESATLTVKPVTRLTIEELIKSEGTTKTQMFLMTGRVRAEVTPKEGEKADFKVKSPTATASVRGTGFEFDGQNLLVDHGAVQFESETGIGISQIVAVGEFSTVSQTGTVTTPVAVVMNNSDNLLQAVQSASIAHANNIALLNTRNPIDPVIKGNIKPNKGEIKLNIGWKD